MTDQTPIVFLDTETTGLHPGREVWEVAMIRRQHGTDDEAVFMIEDVDLSNAEPMGLKIGRFYDRHPMFDPVGYKRAVTDVAAVPSSQAASIVERWTRGAVIVGAVPNFDTEVLDTLLRRHRLLPTWHYHLMDVETLAVGWLQHWAPFTLKKLGGPPWKSDELAEACGIEPMPESERHTALGDARWVRRWWGRIMGVQPND